MAKKKKAKKAKNVAKKKAISSVPWRTGNSMVTDFLKKFRLFLSKVDPQNRRVRLWNWPPQNEPRSTSLITIGDVYTMLRTLMGPTPPPPAAPGSYLAQVAAFVSAYPWPSSPRYKARKGMPYGFPAPTVNLYEIAQVVDLMLQAINDGGDDGGGGGSRWPPPN